MKTQISLFFCAISFCVLPPLIWAQNEPEWAGRKVIDRFHADLSATYDEVEDEWLMRLDRGEFDDPGLLFEFDEVLIIVTDYIVDEVWEGDDPLDFIGDPGTPFAIIPASISGTGLEYVHLGTNAYGVGNGIFTNRPFPDLQGNDRSFSGGRIDFVLREVRGPGEYFAFAVNVDGDRLDYHNSRELGTSHEQIYPESAGGHTHPNMAFTKRGLHEVIMRNEGELVSSNEMSVSEDFAIPFLVDPRSFHWWLIEHFPYSEGVDLQGQMALPFDDSGIPLLHAYAFGLDPHQTDRRLLPKVLLETNEGTTYPVLQFGRPEGVEDRDDRSDLLYQVAVSTDLETWELIDMETESVEMTTVEIEDHLPPAQQITFLDRPVSSDSRIFLRVVPVLTIGELEPNQD
ncbi:MAG: hypothetical protein JJT75_08340 [Opitutales bacterium]|nr:hypothetical protein [Opitutales bacterium]MCH8540993.1 hypothetical protein [Opitutales bacterium]